MTNQILVFTWVVFAFALACICNGLELQKLDRGQGDNRLVVSFEIYGVNVSMPIFEDKIFSKERREFGAPCNHQRPSSSTERAVEDQITSVGLDPACQNDDGRVEEFGGQRR